MSAKRTLAVILSLFAILLAPPASGSAKQNVVVPSGHFGPLTDKPSFDIYSSGEGIEWVEGEGSVWIAGVDLPPRARMTSMVVFCLDNVEASAVVRLFKVKGDGSPPQKIETVVTGGSSTDPGTGYMSNKGLVDEPRVDRGVYHYYVTIALPPKPDQVKGILRVNAVEIQYEK